jgi:hypothetical protein
VNTAATTWLLVLSGLMAAAAIERYFAERRELKRRRALTCCEHCTNTTNRLRAASIPAQRNRNEGNRS